MTGGVEFVDVNVLYAGVVGAAVVTLTSVVTQVLQRVPVPQPRQVLFLFVRDDALVTWARHRRVFVS